MPVRDGIPVPAPVEPLNEIIMQDVNRPGLKIKGVNAQAAPYIWIVDHNDQNVFYIDAAKNIVIGHTDPAILTVGANTLNVWDNLQVKGQNASDNLQLGSDGVTSWVWQDADIPIRFATNNIQRLRIRNTSATIDFGVEQDVYISRDSQAQLVFGSDAGLGAARGQIRFPAGFSSYTSDGVWDSNARPSKVYTPGSGVLLFGYHDTGFGDYGPSLGFQHDHNQVAPTLIIQSRKVTSGTPDSFNRFGIRSDGALEWGSGTAVQDATLRRLQVGQLGLNAELLLDRGNTSFAVLSAFIAGNTERFFTLLNSGHMAWGPGNAAADVNLYRRSNNQLGTDDEIFVNRTGVEQAFSAWVAPGDTQRRIAIYSDGTLAFGSGAAIHDIILYRAASPGETLALSGRFFQGRGSLNSLADLSIGLSAASSDNISAAIQFRGGGIEHGFLNFVPHTTPASEFFEFKRSGTDNPTGGNILFRIMGSGDIRVGGDIYGAEGGSGNLAIVALPASGASLIRFLTYNSGVPSVRFTLEAEGALRINNISSAPSSTPSASGFLYVESGALKYKGSSGTVTTVANA